MVDSKGMVITVSKSQLSMQDKREAKLQHKNLVKLSKTDSDIMHYEEAKSDLVSSKKGRKGSNELEKVEAAKRPKLDQPFKFDRIA